MKRLGGAYRARVVVMAKEPIAGRVKTRLARDVGVAVATSFYRHALGHVAARLGDRRWQLVMAVAPDCAVRSRLLPRRVQRRAQGGGSLGQRMQRVMDRMPPGPCIIVGSDIPGVTATHIAAAFRALGRNDVVFGPAPDGGYWLVGFARRVRVMRAFQGVRWSTEHALNDTLQGLAGLRIAQVAMLDDIDEAADFSKLGAARGRRVLLR